MSLGFIKDKNILIDFLNELYICLQGTIIY
jgi:hypothetical protein